MKSENKILVTCPSLPPLDDYVGCLREIWDAKWLTNNGQFHRRLEDALCAFTGVPYCSLFNNGTIALEALLSVLELKGEVITTPFTFVATASSIIRAGLKPVFVDIDPQSMNISPEAVEAAITEQTVAILPVHVYGNPCDNESLQAIADKHSLKLIYDAAHAFGVSLNCDSVLNFGDASMVSFHATKVFSTVEGGAIFTRDKSLKEMLDKYKNFCISGETQIDGVGTNGKLNELQAAFGMLNLRNIDDNIACRRALAEKYRELLADVDGIKVLNDFPGVRHNYAYFPILVDEKQYGMSRDELCDKLKEHNIFARRYFYPLLTDFSAYNDSNCRIEELPVAKRAAKQVLCLPLHTELTEENVTFISENLNVINQLL